jgi:predicted AAA+ superfamily ATPase
MHLTMVSRTLLPNHGIANINTETLSGISTVRAYAEEVSVSKKSYSLMLKFAFAHQNRFLKAADHALDLENRAYYM